MFLRVGLLTSVLALASCAADINEVGLDLREDKKDQETHENVFAEEMRNISKYQLGAKSHLVEYFTCSPKKSKGVILVVNPDHAAFEKGVCNDAMAQTLIKEDYDVIALNRPGYGASQPPRQDFSGPATLSAAEIVVSSFENSSKKEITGLLGIGGGAVTAGFLSKRIKGDKFLLIVNGIYDMEAFVLNTKDARYRKLLQEAMTGVDASEFNEQRSLAWDTSGLPPQVIIYHGKGNDIVPASQAKAFRDTLATEEYDVHLEEVEGLKHDVEGNKLRTVLNAMLKRVK